MAKRIIDDIILSDIADEINLYSNEEHQYSDIDLVKGVEQIMKNKVDITGDTMTGPLVAQNNIEYLTKQVRNVVFSTEEPTDADGNNGDIQIVYEE